MNVRTLAALFILAPAAAGAQILVAPPTTTRVQQPQLRVAIHDPSMYIYDEYRVDGVSYQMHYMDDLALAAYSHEAITGGLQGLASDRRGNVYGAVWVGPSEHSYVMQMRKSGKWEGPLKRATAVATDNQGRIYITDADLGQVLRIDDMTGANLATFGSFGSGLGQLRNPQGIAVDRQGHIYIADTGNNRIVRIDDMNGGGWATYDGAAYGGRALQVILPKDIALDSKGRLYYLRSDNGYVVRVDDIGGANVQSWGGPAPGTGNYLVEPRGIAIDAQDRIYVTDIQTGFLTRIDDITGAGRVVLYQDAASARLFRRPTHIAVFNPRLVGPPIR